MASTTRLAPIAQQIMAEEIAAAGGREVCFVASVAADGQIVEARAVARGTPDMVLALSVTQVFDSVAVRIDGPRAWDEHFRIAWQITDEDAAYLLELRNGALHHRTITEVPADVTTFTLARHALIGRSDVHQPAHGLAGWPAILQWRRVSRARGWIELPHPQRQSLRRAHSCRQPRVPGWTRNPHRL